MYFCQAQFQLVIAIELAGIHLAWAGLHLVWAGLQLALPGHLQFTKHALKHYRCRTSTAEPKTEIFEDDFTGRQPQWLFRSWWPS